MKTPSFIKSKSFKVYLIIGLFVYIVPYLFGLTNAVRNFIDEKNNYQNYVDQIKKIYETEDQDLMICVQGTYKNSKNIEYWIIISSSTYNKYLDNKNLNTNLLVIKDQMIDQTSCNDISKVGSNYSEKDINIDDLLLEKNIYFDNVFKHDMFFTDENTMFLAKYKEGGKYRSKIIFIRVLNSKVRLASTFLMEITFAPDQLNPLWYLLYIPAFILDILLWPMYLLLFLYSALIAPPPR